MDVVDVVDVLTDSKDALTVRNESNRHTHSSLLCNSRALSFRRLLLTFHSLIRIFMATPRRYFLLQAALLGADKPAVVATDAHFASALRKVQTSLTFHSLIRIFALC